MRHQPDAPGSIWDNAHLRLTLVSLLTVMAMAYQGLALATIAPIVTSNLGDKYRYSWGFNDHLIPQHGATALTGREVDRHPAWQGFYPAIALLVIDFCRHPLHRRHAGRTGHRWRRWHAPGLAA